MIISFPWWNMTRKEFLPRPGRPSGLSGVTDGDGQVSGPCEDVLRYFLFIIRALFFPAPVGVPLALSANKGCVLDRQHDPELLAELLDRNGNRRTHIGLATARARKLRNGPGCLCHRFHGDLLFPVRAAAGPEKDRKASSHRGNDPAHARQPAVTAYGLPSDPVEGFPDLLNGYLPVGR